MYFVEKTKKDSLIKRFDFILFISVIILTIIGLFVLESATRTMNSGSRIMMVQIISVIIGIILAFILSAIDYKLFKDIGGIFYWLSMLMLFLVLFDAIGHGREELGSNSWIKLPGGVNFQPSEIAKIGFILYASKYLENLKEGIGNNNMLKLIIAFIIPVVLILRQPDYGQAAIFLVIFLIMLFLWGVPIRYFALVTASIAAISPIVWYFFLNDARKGRIIEFMFPGHDPLGGSYQLDRAKMAIGSGRLFGYGLGNGLQSQSTPGVPVKESDFIFTVVGEELGFIGALAIIILIAMILFRCLNIARNSRDVYGESVAAGIMGAFVFQFFENIGMNLGLLPVTGVPLPFVSAGGSAMITNFLAIGVIISISARRKKKLKK